MRNTLKAATLPHSRRDFLGLAIHGSAVAATATLPGISAAAQTKGQTSMQTTTSNTTRPRSASAWAACRLAMSSRSSRKRTPKQTLRCEHRDLILTRSAYDHKRVRPLKPMVGGGQISGVLSPRTGPYPSYKKVGIKYKKLTQKKKTPASSCGRSRPPSPAQTPPGADHFLGA